MGLPIAKWSNQKSDKMFVAEEFWKVLKVQLIYLGRFNEWWSRIMYFRHWSKNNEPNSDDSLTKKVAKRQIKSKHDVRWIFRLHARSPTWVCFRRADCRRYFSSRIFCETKKKIVPQKKKTLPSYEYLWIFDPKHLRGCAPAALWSQICSGTLLLIFLDLNYLERALF